LSREPMVVAMARSHPLAGKRVLSLSALAKDTFILPPHRVVPARQLP